MLQGQNGTMFPSAVLQHAHAMLNSSCGGLTMAVSDKMLISTLNSLLTRRRTRMISLELLQDLIPYCTLDILTENSLFWSSCCLGSDAEESTHEVKLNLLTKILENTANLDSFNKQFAAQYLNSTLKACLAGNSKEERIAGLKCLTQCMKKFPTWFGNYTRQLELYCLKSLDHSDELEAETAAICFMRFLETGAAGLNGTNHVKNFAKYFEKFCGTIKILFNNLFESSTDMRKVDKNEQDFFDFASIPQEVDAPKAEEILGKRILNSLVFLKAMISYKFSVEKRIHFKSVLDIIHKGLSTHTCFTETTLLNTRLVLLNKLQLRMLNILRVLIMGYLPTVLPFSVVVETTLLNIFRRIQECDCLHIDAHLKISAYKCLITWLSRSKSANESSVQDKYIDCILPDILPNKRNLMLNDNKTASTNGKTRNKIMCTTVMSEKLCVYGLETLKCLLARSFSFDEELLKMLISSIVTTLSDIQIGTAETPYNNVSCQTKLYETAVSFLNLQDVNVLPSMHLLVNIFHKGMTSSNCRITKISSQGLDLIETISYPVCSTLQMCDPKFAPIQEQCDCRRIKNYEKVPNYESNSGKEVTIISNILVNTTEEVLARDASPTVNETDELDSNVDQRVNSEDVLMTATDDAEEEDPDCKKIVSCTDNTNSDLETMYSAFHNMVQQ